MVGGIVLLCGSGRGLACGRQSPNLVASIATFSSSVLDYLRSAAEDGTLWEATLSAVRRLLIGYGLGILVGLPLGLLTASFALVP